MFLSKQACHKPNQNSVIFQDGMQMKEAKTKTYKNKFVCIAAGPFADRALRTD